MQSMATANDAGMDDKAFELAACAGGPQLPQAAGNRAEMQQLQQVPTPARKRGSRQAKIAQTSSSGDLWVALGAHQCSYRERLQARGQEAMQRTYMGTATQAANSPPPPPPLPPAVTAVGTQSAMFMRQSSVDLWAAQQQQQQQQPQQQQQQQQDQQYWDLAACSPYAGPPAMAAVIGSPMGTEVQPSATSGQLFGMGGTVVVEALPASTGSQMFTVGSPLGSAMKAEALPPNGQIMPIGAWPDQPDMQPHLPWGRVMLPDAATHATVGQPQQITPQMSSGSESSPPSISGTPWSRDGLMVALMPEAAQLDCEQIAAQLRAAAPCSYDD
mmetsp:Transcript_94542/g.237193  ORF Transcript_94542/g.237193 Transcript_94542/m.237193 type:complete len:329 (-) Transcript_94542:386-1372(-)